eukprot:828861-Prymnesium_polylepis.1
MRDGRQEAEFVSLDDWRKEARQFRALQTIPFFSSYYRWRAYIIWKQQLNAHKRKASSTSLTDQAFILHPIFGGALVRVRSLCEELHSLTTHALRPSATGASLDTVAHASAACGRALKTELQQFEGAVLAC